MIRSVPTDLHQARGSPVQALAAGGGALVGLCIGFGLGWMMDAPPGPTTGMLAVAVGIALAIAGLHFLRVLGRAGASMLDKDNGALPLTHHAIDHALAAPGCAVAHSVRSIARASVIDYLVATPVRLWVITVSDRRIPREGLPNVLAEIANNTTAVWDWAPKGTPVRGCLVVGRERRQARTRYDYGKGPVVVHTPASLARELKAESGRSPELDERVSDAVVKLGPVSG